MTNPAAERLRREMDETPIDEGWVACIAQQAWFSGGIAQYRFTDVVEVRFHRESRFRRESMSVFVGEHYIEHIRTRGQLRLLLRALGVEGEGK